MSEYIAAINSTDLLNQAAAVARDSSGFIKVKEVGDNFVWRVDTYRSVKQLFSLGLYGKNQSRELKRALVTLGEREHKSASPKDKLKGHEPSVQLDNHNIAAGAFVDYISEIETNGRKNFALAVTEAPFWDTVRHIESPDVSAFAVALDPEAKAESREKLEIDLNRWADNEKRSNSLNSGELHIETVKQAILTAFDTDSSELDLTGKGLESIPPLGELKQLKVLALSDNFITSLKGLDTINSLEKLQLNQNPLLAVPADLGEKLPKLEILDISGTLLSTVPSNITLPATLSVAANSTLFLTIEAIDTIKESIGNTDSRAHQFPPLHNQPRSKPLIQPASASQDHLNYGFLKEVAEQCGVETNEADALIREVRQYSDSDAIGHAHGLAISSNDEERERPSLEENIAFYYKAVGLDVPEGLISKLQNVPDGDKPTVEQLKALGDDLERLTKSKGSPSVARRDQVARSIVTILDAANADAGYRKHLVSYAGNLSATCDDRASLELSKLEQGAHLIQVVRSENPDVKSIQRQFIETAVYDEAVEWANREGEERAAKQISELRNKDLSQDDFNLEAKLLNDQTEWELSYLTVLRNRGHLSFGASDMLFKEQGFSVQKVQADIPKILARVDKAKAIALTAKRLPFWIETLEELSPEFKTAKLDLADERANKYFEFDEDDPNYDSLVNGLSDWHTEELASLAVTHTDRWLSTSFAGQRVEK